MSKQKYYCQCSMRKKNEYGYKLHVGWIPEKFAKKGKIIKLKWEDGTWEDGWEVTFVGSRKEAKQVESTEIDYLNQRKASDV
jgi:hypothetical protein